MLLLSRRSKQHFVLLNFLADRTLDMRDHGLSACLTIVHNQCERELQDKHSRAPPATCRAVFAMHKASFYTQAVHGKVSPSRPPPPILYQLLNGDTTHAYLQEDQ